MLNRILLLLLLVFSLPEAFAQTQPVTMNARTAIQQQKLARQFVEQRNWPMARDAAKLATASAPKAEWNRDAWLILATIEERLNNLAGAETAYAKYLSLSPSPNKKLVVEQRLAETKIKAEQYYSYKWGSRSSGLILGTSPTFGTKTADEIKSDMGSAMDLGLRFGSFSIGFKKAVGKAGAFQAPTTTGTNPTYANVAAGARHVVEEIYLQYDIELTSNPDRQAMVWSIPLYMAGVANSIRTSGPEKLYTSFGYDIASGLSVSFYTKSAISFDLTGLYHLGIPFTEMKRSEDSGSAKTPLGELITGSTSGVEMRLGIKILFGANPPEAD